MVVGQGWGVAACEGRGRSGVSDTGSHKGGVVSLVKGVRRSKGTRRWRSV